MGKYQPGNKDNWYGRIDTPEHESNRRIHQVVKCLNLQNEKEMQRIETGDYVFLGYAVDEGVRLNKGRIGAKNGPDHIRKSLGGLSLHMQDQNVFDAGNVEWISDGIAGVQNLLANHVCSILVNGGRSIILGGGHDVALGHFSGIAKALPLDSRIGIINFDAHYDLRICSEGDGNSGTPFFQIKEEQKENFLYLPIGIRKSGNTVDLDSRAKIWCEDIIYLDELYGHKIDDVFERIKKVLMLCDCIYLTIDLDGFSQCIAPGVSAPNPTGLSWEIFLPLFKRILSSGKVISLDLAECNPDYDLDNITAKLASEIIWNYIHANI